MIDFYFRDFYIKGNEEVFYIFLGVMAFIILITLIFIIKEVKRVNK